MQPIRSPANTHKFSNLSCQELILYEERVQKRSDRDARHYYQIGEDREMCAAVFIGTIVGIPFAPLCFIGTEEKLRLAREPAERSWGDLQGVREAISTCQHREEKSEVNINNNINIDNNNRQ